MAYNSVHGRYFAGKQVKCEFVSLTKWKVAICGEYMKSRFKTCSRGSACNFLHCFSNPGGDYEWADCDKPPPRYWVKKMTSLFGYSDDSWHDKPIEQPSPKDQQHSSRIFTSDRDSYHNKRHRSSDTNQHIGSSSRSHNEESRVRKSRRHGRQKDDKYYEDETEYKNDTDSDGNQLDRRHRENSENRPRYYNRRDSKSRDYYGKSRRSHGSSSDDELYTERRHVYTKRSRHRKKVLESSNDDEESDDAELRRHEKKKTNSTRHHRRSRRHNHDGEVDHQESENESFAKKQKRHHRKPATDTRSRHRHDRSRSRDSDSTYLLDKNETIDRWEPDGSPSEHSSKAGIKDYQVYYDRKPKDRRSSRETRLGSVEEELKDSEGVGKNSRHGENWESYCDDRREKRKRI